MSSSFDSQEMKNRKSIVASSNAAAAAANNQVIEARTKAILREKDSHIAQLQKEVAALTNKLAKQQKLLQNHHSSSSNASGHVTNHTPKRRHLLSPFGNVVHSSTDSDYGTLRHERSRMGRNASIATANELNNLYYKEETRHNSNKEIVHRILEMFQDPKSHISYLRSMDFAKDILRLTKKIKGILEAEPRVAFVQSPAYVFGDIHGNLEDLHFFSDNVWRLGMALTAGNFVFLGDYVDRGMSCLECIAYLFSMKLLLPHKVFLLRGNHETRDVNGWEEHYGERSFLWQCRQRFGDDVGFKVWNTINDAFDRMPLAAVIDQDIFCVHGGIPRPVTAHEDGTYGSRVQDIMNVPRVAGINPPLEFEDERHQQVASDCIWSDPASEEQELKSVDPESGYGESLRGGGAICFGHKAVKDFLAQHGFSYIMRAHEAHADGVAVSKGGKVFTIFSTSKDHNQGREAMAGCILVDFENLQVINRSPAYKNVYVHRRDSVSIAKLSEKEIEEHTRLGLITESVSHDNDDESDEEEAWESYDEDDESSEEENYTFSGRKSSVDPTHCISSPPGHGMIESFDFSNVTSNRNKSQRDLQRISEDDEDTLLDDESMDL